MHIKVENQVHNYPDKPEKIETKNVLINEVNILNSLDVNCDSV